LTLSCSDLNVNSVIAKPDHNDLLLLPYGDEDDATYTMQGYAYAGGGRRVARVEISLDGGDNWTLVSLYVFSSDTNRVSETLNTHFWSSTYPEDLYRTAHFEDEIYGTFDLTERETCL